MAKNLHNAALVSEWKKMYAMSFRAEMSSSLY